MFGAKFRVNFLALFASKPHIFMCGALKLSGIVRANFRLNIAIAMFFLSLTFVHALSFSLRGNGRRPDKIPFSEASKTGFGGGTLFRRPRMSGRRMCGTQTFLELRLFPRKWRSRGQESELPGLAWNSQTCFSQTSATTRFMVPFKSKLLPAVLLFLRIYFPKITVTVTVLKFGWITITVTVLAPAVAPSFPLTPNYHLESHLNSFSQNYRYRYRLEMFVN